MNNRVVFLEGPAYAGKTTYLKNLDESRYERLPEATEFVGGDAHFPDAPTDARTMIRCSYFFGHMEHLRLAELATDKLVVADRFTPLSSLLFYQLRYKEGHIPAKEYAIGMAIAAKIFQEIIQLPPETQVGFLRFTINSQEDFTRRLTRGTRNTDFNDWRNFRQQSEWYKKLLPTDTPEINELTTLTSPEQTPLQASSILQNLLQPHHYVEEGHRVPNDAHDAAVFVDDAEKEVIEREVEGLVYGKR